MATQIVSGVQYKRAIRKLKGEHHFKMTLLPDNGSYGVFLLFLLLTLISWAIWNDDKNLGTIIFAVTVLLTVLWFSTRPSSVLIDLSGNEVTLVYGDKEYIIKSVIDKKNLKYSDSIEFSCEDLRGRIENIICDSTSSNKKIVDMITARISRV